MLAHGYMLEPTLRSISFLECYYNPPRKQSKKTVDIEVVQANLACHAGCISIRILGIPSVLQGYEFFVAAGSMFATFAHALPRVYGIS